MEPLPGLRSLSRLGRAALFAALLTCAASAQAADPLCEPPRLGVVLKGGSAAAKAHVAGLAEAFLEADARVEIVVLESLPSKSSKTAPPRLVLVIDEAKATPTGVGTYDYAGKGGRDPARIRWRGATALARATLHVFSPTPGKLAELVETVDRSRPPEKHVFEPDETKAELVIEPDAVLGEAIHGVARRALACAVGTELWRRRAELGRISEELDEKARAAFWIRTACAAAEPEPACALVPWRSLELAALETWRRAQSRAPSGAPSDEKCEWCGAALGEPVGECRCPNATSLAGALCVMKRAADRVEHPEDRAPARAIEVAWERLFPALPARSSSELEKVARRLVAEHESDLANLKRKFSVQGFPEPETNRDWYVVLALRDPLDWIPKDADLVRHAARTIQAFATRTGVAAASFDVESANATIGLVQRRKFLVYTAVDRREFSNTKTELLESFLERALWANARGIPKAP